MRASYERTMGAASASVRGADRLWGHLEARSGNATVVLDFVKVLQRRPHLQPSRPGHP
jgi:hypothetical protein